MKGDKSICEYCGKEFIQKNNYVSRHCNTSCAARHTHELKGNVKTKRYVRVNYNNDKPNPNPVTVATCILLVSAITRGETIKQIAEDTGRDPQQLINHVKFLVANGRYEQIKRIVEEHQGRTRAQRRARGAVTGVAAF